MSYTELGTIISILICWLVVIRHSERLKEVEKRLSDVDGKGSPV